MASRDGGESPPPIPFDPGSGKRGLIRFYNTYEPVTPLYRDLLPALADREFDVRVFVSRAAYRSERPPLEEAAGIDRGWVVRLWAGVSSPGSTLKKAWISLTYAAGAAVRTVLGRRAALNVFLTQPPLFTLWGTFLKSLRGEPYVVVLMDLYPDVVLQDRSDWIPSWFASLLRWFSRQSLRRANRIVVIGRCTADRLESEGISRGKITLIPNWCDSQIEPHPSAACQLRQRLDVGSSLVVLYSGNMGRSHRFETILEVARRLDGNEDVLFLFIGAGARRGEIESAMARFNLGNVTLLPFQPLARLGDSLSSGDVHYVSLREGYQGLVVPSKVYGSLAAGRPVVYEGNADGEVARMIREGEIGRVIAEGDADELERILRSYAERRDCAVEQGKRARRLSERGLSPRSGVERYLDLVEDVHSNHSLEGSPK